MLFFFYFFLCCLFLGWCCILMYIYIYIYSYAYIDIYNDHHQNDIKSIERSSFVLSFFYIFLLYIYITSSCLCTEECYHRKCLKIWFFWKEGISMAICYSFLG
ncbi:hypothetical protein BDA99DRAFT_345210 [Phascolomyces articulosus]|uniref:Uncharacterized protein n=1 Tax=Phascolomyces articulosus TaxID=60185 RepID=A0AAD5K4V3_9FUNG|nr:hypothetical protein BDA99DRAFT_345210 [Phascolomyces articulosus]